MLKHNPDVRYELGQCIRSAKIHLPASSHDGHGRPVHMVLHPKQSMC